MPVTPTYPGVYIEEVSSGVRTITGVATSITAFLGYAARGPIDTPIKVRNFGDFEREFGGIEVQSPMSYSVNHYFQNGGSEALIVRVTNGGGVAKGALTYSANKTSLNVTANSKGKWGNYLRAKVDYATANADGWFNLTISEHEDSEANSQQVRSEVFRNLSMNANSPRFVVDVLKDESSLVTGEVDPAAVADITAADKGTSRSGDLTGFDMNLLDDDHRKIAVSVNGDGPHEIELFDSGSSLADLDAVASAIKTKVQEINNATLFADFECVFDNGRITATSGEGGQQSSVQFRNSTDSNAAILLKLGIANGGSEADAFAKIRPEAKQFDFLAGGSDGIPPNPTDLIGSRNNKTGLYALEDADLFNLLCMPGQSDFGLLSAAIPYCEERRAFLLIDPPATTPSEVTQWIEANANLRHRNVAVYFPRIKAPDPLKENRLRQMPASGAIAGVFARTDAARGVWKAPAGIDTAIRGAGGFEYKLTDGENGDLNQIGINALRAFPVVGNVVWGSRTLRGADALADTDWKYVPVRRLALFLEESLFRGTQWAVFEPNDEPLWAQLRLNIGAFMQNLFRQGAFQGQTPKDAYFVKVDSETTTQNHINLGIVNIIVGFAPLKPAEFVIIKIQQMTGQIET